VENVNSDTGCTHPIPETGESSGDGVCGCERIGSY